ncbi:MAG: sialidase family protein, partial [Verrucomicrobiota bacterium]
TWGAQQVIVDMGEHNGKAQELNGVSDPGLIIDPKTGEIFCFALWMQDKPGKHQWRGDGSEVGHEIGKSAQLLMVSSKDDGLTWSEPKNMTRDWKDPSWILYAPSPQQGIALPDGTLVMPMQGRDAEDKRFSNLIISKDHGKTWTVSPPASFGNNECQAALLSDGAIMLNCRTLENKFRTVMVTRDLGQTWEEHPTNRNTLIEPVCNGSLYRFGDVLLFANPHSQKGRTHHSIQISFDDGMTWPAENRLLLDEGRGAGYPSLSRVDDSHVGIVYEGSGSHVVFEKIPIQELVKPQ